MKKYFILFLMGAFVFNSCSKDSEEITPTADFKVRASSYESDPNFLSLAQNYGTLGAKIEASMSAMEELPKTLSPRDVVQMAGFTKIEAYREFQFQQHEYYKNLVTTYELKTEAQLEELSQKLAEKASERAYSGRIQMRGCLGDFFGCLMSALNAFNNYLVTYGGVGCDWNPGSDCWDGMVAYENYTIRRIGGCISDYWGC